MTGWVILVDQPRDLPRLVEVEEGLHEGIRVAGGHRAPVDGPVGGGERHRGRQVAAGGGYDLAVGSSAVAAVPGPIGHPTSQARHAPQAAGVVPRPVLAARHARERKLPYLGLCLGMQVMVIEFARHVLDSDEPNSTEFNMFTRHPVIDLLPEQKDVAEKAAKRVAGVHAVANDIEVRLPAIDQRPDPDIARDAVAALKAELPISHDRIKVVVKDGWITLEGAVEWQYQKTTADSAVRKVKGVKGVTNVITVKPKVEPSDLKRKIQDAFKRSAEVDADRITVEANGSEVILKGTVRSWIEREEAERVAWSAPGVTKVEDRIVVSP